MKDSTDPWGLKVTITQKHIDTAIPKNSGHCLFADAIRDSNPNARFISVDLATIRYSDQVRGKRYTYLTPGLVQRMLLAFDAGDVELLRPVTFRLHAPVQQEVRKKKGEPQDRKSKLSQTRHTSIPIKTGGRGAPTGALAGRTVAHHPGKVHAGKRREFGMRLAGRHELEELLETEQQPQPEPEKPTTKRRETKG